MASVTQEPYAEAAQAAERAFAPVIRVRMREQDRLDLLPGAADGSQTARQLARSQAAINQKTIVVGLHVAGIAAAAAAQGCEMEAHPISAAMVAERLYPT